jgi:hypothetical protein
MIMDPSKLPIAVDVKVDFAAVLSAAAQSTLGILALLVIVVSFLAFIYFRVAPHRIRITAFLCMFVGLVAFGAAVVHQQSLEFEKGVAKQRQEYELKVMEENAKRDKDMALLKAEIADIARRRDLEIKQAEHRGKIDTAKQELEGSMTNARLDLEKKQTDEALEAAKMKRISEATRADQCKPRPVTITKSQQKALSSDKNSNHPGWWNPAGEGVECNRLVALAMQEIRSECKDIDGITGSLSRSCSCGQLMGGVRCEAEVSAKCSYQEDTTVMKSPCN